MGLKLNLPLSSSIRFLRSTLVRPWWIFHDPFVKEISRARTFGFMRDIEQLRERRLALGGNL
ncbi:MAG: UDP-3-O-acyl-N-acetylglucosamine deacetylase [Candidatus Competibacteraceae bacterium]